MSHLKQTNKQQTWTKAATRQHLGVCVLARAARSCAGETRSFLGMLRGLLLTLVSTFYSPLVYSLFSCVWFFFQETYYYRIKIYLPRENGDLRCMILMISVLKTALVCSETLGWDEAPGSPGLVPG